MTEQSVVVTGANSRYFGSLIHMLSTLWAESPGFESVLVYDLGLSAAERSILTRVEKVTLRRVPPFCPHYLDVENFAWKTAAICDALEDGGAVLWLDAGIEITAPLDDLFDTVRRDGYLFTVTPLNHPNCRIGHLSHARSLELLGAESDYFRNAFMVNAGVMGYLAGHPAAQIAYSARQYAANPEIIMGPRHSHRHDQTIYSVLRVRNGLPAQYNIFQLENVNPRFPFLVRAVSQDVVPAETAESWSPAGQHIYLLITRDALSFGRAGMVSFRPHSFQARILLLAASSKEHLTARLRPPYRSLKTAVRRLGRLAS